MTATTTIPTTTTTATATATVIKETKPVKYVRDPHPITPNINEVNTTIDDYNALIGEARSFRPLSSLFEKIIRLNQYELKDFLYSILVGFGYDVTYADGYLFAKGNVPVMLCAHMDTVHKDPVEDIYMSDKGYIWSPQGIGGDDRCGIYTALMTIRNGIKPYILFTEDEEIGCIGAGYFADDINSGIIKTDDININFIIEVDRKGSNDSVYYDCDNPEFEKFIDTYGFKTEYGSCSDISEVAPALGVAAVNFSSGYYKAHTLSEYIILDELYDIVERVNKIVKDVADGKTVKYEYIEAKYSYGGYASKGYYGWDGDYGYNKFDYKYDEYGYGRYYEKNKSAKSYGKVFEEDTSTANEKPIWDDMILAAPIEESAIVILDDGSMTEADGSEDYYIGEDNKIYKLVDYVDSEFDEDEFNFIVTPVDASVYTKEGNHYQYREEDAQIVYVVNDELSYYEQ